MIGGLCKKGSLSEADMLFKKMGEEDGTAPNASTMKMVIDMLSDGRLNKSFLDMLS
ncbi:hypothetical protein F2Q69_00060763 [Brassica cretica]|uniref:Pentatricopeptide repeat-containing protein n=1 Tax=Brassica cretica TaxID=69181 RepID=A0A8S9RMU7_BRACR|nr:hypothetical protein F2Q69_00060763 [Brassica cretica]